MGGLLACSGAASSSEEADPAPGMTVLATAERDGILELEVAYPSGDLTVRGFLYLPPGAGPAPAVVFNHGGVSGVSADMKRRSRDLAALGYTVLTPAYRGEGGSEGQVEVAAGEVDDILAGAALLAGHPRVDPDRIGVAGSSHGALIAVLAAAREPERFACVVEACGVMDVVSWYTYLVENDFDVSDSLSVAVYGHGPEDRPEAFARRQAVAVAADIAVPVLLQQGQADRIVPPFQARLMAEALEEAGRVEVLLLEYPLLGHAFWFWDDPKSHTEAELVQAEEAWSDFTEFLAGQLAPGNPGGDER